MNGLQIKTTAEIKNTSTITKQKRKRKEDES